MLSYSMACAFLPTLYFLAGLWLYQPSAAAVVPLHRAETRPEDALSSASNLPLLIWHGLGDAYDTEGIRNVGDTYRHIYPNSLVYAIRLSDDGNADRHASFWGNASEQVTNVCDEIKAIPELAHAPAVNALGFSQGGLFMRALVQRCNALPVRNLITFGSPHNGIDTFARCNDDDWFCKWWSGTLKDQTWSPLAQSSLVPAQYFRDPANLDDYLKFSNFLGDISNERQEKNPHYWHNIASLNLFVSFAFTEEDVVHPPFSSWFAEYNATSGDYIELQQRQLYREDWLGLRALDSKDGLLFLLTPGKHMHIGDGVLEKAFSSFYAPPRKHEEEVLEATQGSSEFVSDLLSDLQLPLHADHDLEKEEAEQSLSYEIGVSGSGTILDRLEEYYGRSMEETFS